MKSEPDKIDSAATFLEPTLQAWNIPYWLCRNNDEKSTKKPGCPEKQGVADDKRDDLITTAELLFGELGYDSVSLKQISARADVTPAMISYYFKDKRGLMHAVLENGLNRLFSRIEKIADQSVIGRTAEDFIEDYIEVITQHPWIPQILVREVLSKDSDLRQLFVDQFTSRVGNVLPPRLANEINQGYLRKDLESRFTLLSLVGMCLMPYLVAPVLVPILGYQIDEDFGKAYTDHVKSLFLNGAAGESK